jgi:hypothetical protein
LIGTVGRAACERGDAFTAAGRKRDMASRGAEHATLEVAVGQPTDPDVGLRGDKMAAMKPRTGDGPLEVTKEGRGIVMRVPLEGGGRLVVEMTPDEANALGDALKAIVG